MGCARDVELEWEKLTLDSDILNGGVHDSVRRCPVGGDHAFFCGHVTALEYSQPLAISCLTFKGTLAWMRGSDDSSLAWYTATLASKSRAINYYPAIKC